MTTVHSAHGGIDDELLTVAEAARVVKKTPQTVRAWIHQGRIPHEVTPTGQYLVWRSCLLQSRRSPTADLSRQPWRQEMADRRAASRAAARGAALADADGAAAG